ncbi:uracil-DNA glycosylase [Alkalibacillus salilacus]|uniref:Uracil-DNA glycosylase n=1 Tax=Alkalibacillus salilacus TaxID=284582 RepID=A0ABT9VI78_9BACI|nr:uracil-DNA glycosylase [Alkalibacillus salilacus]MDQ0160676.1 uracil-DNA glycosylase [Alkalibacillus salilacus]
MILPEDWEQILKPEIHKTYFQNLLKTVEQEYAKNVIYPPYLQIFRAFELTPFANVKVVLLGQDPYHQPNQANGLSFSVPKGQAFPPSLRNINKELWNDLGCELPHGDLTQWAEEGVLMLNTSLTVKQGEANSHRGLGWHSFTNYVITQLSESHPHLVFVLWGKQAYQKAQLIQARHTIVHAPHPSPLSAYRGFFGSQPFSQVNHALKIHQQTPIDWCLTH